MQSGQGFWANYFCSEIVNLIIEAGHSWWLVKNSCSKHVIDQYQLGLDPVHMLSERHPIIVARALLYLVILLQQLPSTFDRSQLDATCATLMERYHGAVSGISSGNPKTS